MYGVLLLWTHPLPQRSFPPPSLLCTGATRARVQSVDLSFEQFVEYSLWLSARLTWTICAARAYVSAADGELSIFVRTNLVAHYASAFCAKMFATTFATTQCRIRMPPVRACRVANRRSECCAPFAYIVGGGNGRELGRGTSVDRISTAPPPDTSYRAAHALVFFYT